MRANLAAFAFALGLASGGTASAVTVTGTIVPTPTGDLLAKLFPTDPGVYELSFEFSRPGEGQIHTHLFEIFEFYDRKTGEHQGGDDHVFDNYFAFPAPTSYGSAIFRVGPPFYRFVFPETVVGGGYGDAKVDLSGAFSGPAPVTYSFSVDRIGDIPEPEAWALMILGFGAAGAALRRRRQATCVPAPRSPPAV
jgi:hypothetical protein